MNQSMNSYVKTNWVNGQAPPLSAENLNKIEQGIFDAVEAIIAMDNNKSGKVNILEAIDTAIDTADKYNTIYCQKIGSNYAGLVLFSGYDNYVSGVTVTQYRFSRNNGIEKRRGTSLGSHQYAWDKAYNEAWVPVAVGPTIIDEETSVDWDGEIPDDYEGERGALALYDGSLWYLADIAEYEQSPGRKFYYWTRIAAADNLAAIEADLYSKMSLAPINPTDEQIATLRTGQLYVGENTLAVTTGSGGSKSAYDTKYVDEALSAKQNKIAIWSDGKKDLFRYADKSTYFKVGDYVYANGRTYRLFSVTATSYINDNAKYEYYWVCYPKITRVASLKTKESVSSISVAGFNGITRNSWNVYDLAYVNNDGLYVCTDAKVLENVSPKNPREYEYVWKKLAYLPDDVYTKTEIDAKLGDIESLLSQV